MSTIETNTFEGVMSAESIYAMNFEFDKTQRQSNKVFAIFYYDLERSMRNAKANATLSLKAKELIGQGLKDVKLLDLGDNKFGIVLYDGRQICYDGGHRTKTIKFVLNDNPIPIPKKGETDAEKYVMKLVKEMIKTGKIKETDKYFKFSDLPDDVQNNYKSVGFNVKYIEIANKISEKDLSDFCGKQFLLANSGKAVKSNDKQNAKYAGTKFYSIRKELAEYATVCDRKFNAEDYPNIKNVFSGEKYTNLLSEFRIITRTYKKNSDAMLKLLIRMTDNACWKNSTNSAVIEEICERHIDESETETYEALRTMISDFVPVAKVFGDFMKYCNVWTSILHTFGSARNNPKCLDEKDCCMDRPFNIDFENKENLEGFNPNYLKDILLLKDTRIRVSESKSVPKLRNNEIDLFTTKFSTSSQNHQNTRDISVAIVSTLISHSEVIKNYK